MYVDSGVRRGSDVLKALALGATAVSVGRPLYWGLAVNGAEGVHHILELLREEFNRAMAYCGQNSVDDLEDRLLNIPREWGPFRTENDLAEPPALLSRGVHSVHLSNRQPLNELTHQFVERIRLLKVR